MIFPRPVQRSLFLLLALLATPLAAQDGLLQVTQAYPLSATIDPGRIHLNWHIAPGYYLYRSRVKAKSLTPGVTLGILQLPAGETVNDPYMGLEVIYHQRLQATLPYTATAGIKSIRLQVSYQGCHEVKPKICFPPHTQTLTLKRPTVLINTATTGLLNTATEGPATPRFDRFSRSNNTPLPPEQAFRFSARASNAHTLLLHWQMPKHYYLYRDQTHLSVEGAPGIKLGSPAWPPGTRHEDANYGMTTVYYHAVSVPVPLQLSATAGRSFTLVASFQGCLENSICYPPITRKVALTLPTATTAAAAVSPPTSSVTTQSEPAASGLGAASPAKPDSESQHLAGLLGNHQLLALLLFFLGGLAVAFTPCVLPMLPILSGLVAGRGTRTSPRHAFVVSLVYVLTAAAVYALIGIVAGFAGANLQAALQTPPILIATALVFVALALSMFGLYELQLPAALQARLAGASRKHHSGSLLGAAVMGLLSALIVTSCVTPVLFAGVLYIGQSGSPWFGALALFLFGFGMGLPLLAFGTAAGTLLPRAGPWMNTVKAVFGVGFLGLAIWMLDRILAPSWILLLTGIVLLGSAVYLGALERPRHGAGAGHRLRQSLGLLLLLAALAELIGAAAGSTSLLQPLGVFAGTPNSASNQRVHFQPVRTVAELQASLAAAQAAGKPVLLDYYAAWCVSCKEMEATTFSNPQVVAALGNIVTLQADVTANNAASRALLARYHLFGPPATLFFTADGHEIRAARLIGYENASDFLARLRQHGLI